MFYKPLVPFSRVEKNIGIDIRKCEGTTDKIKIKEDKKIFFDER